MAEIRGTTWDDFDAAVDLLDVRSRAAFGISDVEPEHVRRRWRLPGVDLAADSWVALDDGRLVGHALLESTQHLGVAAFDAKTGFALLARAEARARERGFDRLTVTTVAQDDPVHALVQCGGFDLTREILRMWRPLDGEPAEERRVAGVSVRTYRAADGEDVHALLDEAYAGWDGDYVARDHRDWLAFMTAHEDFDPDLWFLAERGGETVGCALHWRERDRRGWVKDLAVRAAERGLGIGKALLHEAFRTYVKRNATHVGLKVDTTNPTGARQLYERVGFATDQRYEVWVKGL
ncbi:MAG: GNAT family N-acetyltransferase [Gaiellaceae bacterium]